MLKPSLKDFNDDLIVSKFLRLNKSFSINELEKSLNSFTQKIKEYASKNKLKELKASLKILENIKDKSKNYISKESLANVDLALKTSISKGLSYER